MKRLVAIVAMILAFCIPAVAAKYPYSKQPYVKSKMVTYKGPVEFVGHTWTIDACKTHDVFMFRSFKNYTPGPWHIIRIAGHGGSPIPWMTTQAKTLHNRQLWQFLVYAASRCPFKFAAAMVEVYDLDIIYPNIVPPSYLSTVTSFPPSAPKH